VHFDAPPVVGIFWFGLPCFCGLIVCLSFFFVFVCGSLGLFSVGWCLLVHRCGCPFVSCCEKGVLFFVFIVLTFLFLLSVSSWWDVCSCLFCVVVPLGVEDVF